MAIESTINQKAYDRKSDSRNALAEWKNPFEAGKQAWAKFIKESLDLNT